VDASHLRLLAWVVPRSPDADVDRDVTVRTADDRLAELVRADATGGRPKYLFFWKERTSGVGSLGPECLSQFYASPLTVGAVTYRSAEHWMMAEKARLFGDDEALGKILAAPSPRAAKSLGRAVSGFSEDRWARARYGIVVAGNLAKFSQHDDLRSFLASTAGRILVEASPADRVWGIGLAEDDQRARAPSRWRGKNLLGFALMEVREQLSR